MSISEVPRHAPRPMQEAHDRRERFVAMLRDVSARAERDGTLSHDEVDLDLTVTIARTRQAFECKLDKHDQDS